MMITTESAGFALSIAKGLFKLHGRLDAVFAEREATTGPLALPAPTLNLAPPPEKMRPALERLLVDPDSGLSAEDRRDLQTALGGPAGGDVLFPFMKKLLPEQALGRELDLDGRFVERLREAQPDLASDLNSRVALFHLSAGRESRNKSHAWRVALTVVDVLAEFGSENAALIHRDQGIQRILGSALKRFGEADLQRLDETQEILRSILVATLNGILDSKEAIPTENPWLEGLLAALSNTREKNGDDFVVGLVRGQSYRKLVASLLEEGSIRLSEVSSSHLETITSTFLSSMAEIVEEKPDLKGFLQEHWGDMIRAGFGAFEKHGPRLLAGQDPLFSSVLVAVAGDLSKRADCQFLTTDTLVGVVETAVGVVAANPDLRDEILDHHWLTPFVGSVASTMANLGVRETFSRAGVERMVKGVLEVAAEHPELIVDRPGLPQDLIENVLENLSAAGAFGLEEIASAAIGGSLSALAENPSLLSHNYPEFVAALAGRVGTLLAEKKLTRIQGADLLESLTESVLENPGLLLDGDEALAAAVLGMVVEISDGDANDTLTGTALVTAVEEILRALAAKGKAAIEAHSRELLKERLSELISAGLERAHSELGKSFSASEVPSFLRLLVERWTGEGLPPIDPASDVFEEAVVEILDRLAA